MRILVILIISLLIAMPVAAKPQQEKKEVVDIVFSKIEKRLIEEFYGKKDNDDRQNHGKNKKEKKHKGKSNKLPPGLAKRESLPPGLEKQLQRNGTLPPGLAKRDLPLELRRRLPPPNKRHRRVIVDNDVLLIEKATGKILDILLDVAKH